MREKSSSTRPSTTDQILDLLLDALLERQAARQAQAGKPDAIPTPKPSVPPSSIEEATTEPLAASDAPVVKPATEERQPPPKSARRTQKSQHRRPRPGEEGWTPPPKLPSIHLGRTTGRLLLVLVALMVLVNVPINRHGTSLARIMPDTAALVIRDGLVVKGSGPEVYVLEDNRLRWISSLEAFEFFDYHWEQVHIVDDDFLDEFETGRPIHVLLKCQGSPHIYALESGEKRWIKDIPTFVAEGYVWEDVKQVSCTYLRDLPDGPPIPEDAGPPPQP
jgi:hypothetical protein